MLKKRSDFNTENEYIKYTRSYEFLDQYDFSHKTIKEIKNDMCLSDTMIPYIEKAKPVLLEKGQTSAFDMVSLVNELFDMEQPILKPIKDSNNNE